MALGVPGRLRPWIFLTFGTTRVVVRQPYAPAVFTSEEIPGTHFQRLSRPQSTWFCRWEPRKKPSDATGNADGVVYFFYRYSALGQVWAETRAQSVDWYSSGTLRPGQVLRCSLPLLSPAFRRSHFRHQVPQRRERS